MPSILATLRHLLSKEYGASIGALNATDRSKLLLPTVYITHTVLPILLTVAATLYVLHLIVYCTIADRILQHSAITIRKPAQKRKLWYQITNGCMNLVCKLTRKPPSSYIATETTNVL